MFCSYFKTLKTNKTPENIAMFGMVLVVISFLSLLWCHLNFLRFTCCSHVVYVVLTFCKLFWRFVCFSDVLSVFLTFWLWFFSYVLSVMLTFCLLFLRFVCYSCVHVFTCYSYVLHDFLVFWHLFIAHRLVIVSRYGALLPQQSSSSAVKGSRFPPP